MPNIPAMRATPIDGPASALLVDIPQTTGGRGDARGWRRVVAHVVGIVSGRSFAIRTDDSLQTGPPPTRITRTVSTLNGGMLDGRGVSAFPIFAGNAYIPHMPSTPYRKDNANPYRSVDDAVSIPATYAGNPQ